MPSLTLHLLGAPRVERDGAPVVPRRRKSLALLAYLVTTGAEHGRDELAALLWPDAGAAKALASLRVALRDLHETLGGGQLDTARHTIRARDGIWVDATRFEELCAAALVPGIPRASAVAGARAALELYRGDFLRGVALRESAPFEEWQLRHAEHLHRRRVAALRLLAVSDTSPAAAIAHGERLVAVEPLSEEAHRELMHLYARAGRRSDALRQYDTLAGLLLEELGVKPEAETRALYESIKLSRGVLPLVSPRRVGRTWGCGRVSGRGI